MLELIGTESMDDMGCVDSTTTSVKFDGSGKKFQLKSLNGLQKAVNLEQLTVTNCPLQDVSVFSSS